MDTLRKKDYIGIVLKLPVKYMDILARSATNSSRPKTKEATLRLIDHLERYEDISKVGNVTPRKENADD